MNRRGFIRRLSFILASIAGLVSSAAILRSIGSKAASKRKAYTVGHISAFPVDTFTFIENKKLFIYRDHEALKAVSAVCTHLGCTILKTPDGFECPCHGSCYTMEGKVLSGPAPRPLKWYAVEKLLDGRVRVDMSDEREATEKFLMI